MHLIQRIKYLSSQGGDSHAAGVTEVGSLGLDAMQKLLSLQHTPRPENLRSSVFRSLSPLLRGLQLSNQGNLRVGPERDRSYEKHADITTL